MEWEGGSQGSRPKEIAPTEMEQNESSNRMVFKFPFGYEPLGR